jgi:hypothetical protein
MAFRASRAALRSCRNVKVSRDASPLASRSLPASCGSPALSSASNAPNGSEAMSAIAPEFGPKPKRCSASAARAWRSTIMVLPLTRSPRRKLRTSRDKFKAADLTFFNEQVDRRTWQLSGSTALLAGPSKRLRSTRSRLWLDRGRGLLLRLGRNRPAQRTHILGRAGSCFGSSEPHHAGPLRLSGTILSALSCRGWDNSLRRCEAAA